MQGHRTGFETSLGRAAEPVKNLVTVTGMVRLRRCGALVIGLPHGRDRADVDTVGLEYVVNVRKGMHAARHRRQLSHVEREGIERPVPADDVEWVAGHNMAQHAVAGPDEYLVVADGVLGLLELRKADIPLLVHPVIAKLAARAQVLRWRPDGRARLDHDDQRVGCHLLQRDSYPARDVDEIQRLEIERSERAAEAPGSPEN